MPYIWETDAWPNIIYVTHVLQKTFEEIIWRAGKLAGLRAGLSEQDQFDIYVNEVSKEGVNSFAIEGEALDPEHMTQSLIASLRSRDRTAAAGTYRDVAEMMLDARDTAEPMSVDRLNGWHARLFRQDRFLKDVGRLRSEEMQIVTMKQFEVRQVHFEAPPPDRLQAEMAKLIDWIERTSPGAAEANRFATPGRAALAHLRFETLHPYSDGNGRLGRALADFVAAQNPIFEQAPFSLSRAIQENKNDYYDALGTAQSTTPSARNEIDVTPFVTWFASAMLRGIELAAGEAQYIHDRNRFFERHADRINDRQEKALRRVFLEGPDRLAQGLSSKPYQKITGASSATATRDLNDLAEKGILISMGQGGRGTAYRINMSL